MTVKFDSYKLLLTHFTAIFHDNRDTGMAMSTQRREPLSNAGPPAREQEQHPKLCLLEAAGSFQEAPRAPTERLFYCFQPWAWIGKGLSLTKESPLVWSLLQPDPLKKPQSFLCSSSLGFTLNLLLVENLRQSLSSSLRQKTLQEWSLKEAAVPPC